MPSEPNAIEVLMDAALSPQTCFRFRNTRPTRNFRGPPMSRHFNGRIAMWNAIRALNLPPESNVLVPSYCCGVEVDAVRHADVQLNVYRVRSSTHVHVHDLEQAANIKTRAVLLTHYFGFPQPNSRQIADYCKHRGYALIEDCAHALYSAGRVGRLGDVAVYSPHKFLPMASGGLVHCNTPSIRCNSGTFPPPEGKELYHALCSMPPQLSRHGILGRVLNHCLLLPIARRCEWLTRRQSRQAFRQFADGQAIFNPHSTELAMSRLALRLWNRSLHGPIIVQRRRNFRYLLSELNGLNAIQPLHRELAPATCPLVLPAIVENPVQFSRSLSQLRIMVEPWWQKTREFMPQHGFPETNWLRSHLLALPVHQDLGPPQLHALIRAIRHQDTRHAPAPIWQG